MDSSCHEPFADFLCLYCSCRFSVRLLLFQGGKDAASARYIFTKLTPVARALFPVEDDAVLDWLNDDGHPVEPRFYVPLVPLVLVRG